MVLAESFFRLVQIRPKASHLPGNARRTVRALLAQSGRAPFGLYLFCRSNLMNAQNSANPAEVAASQPAMDLTAAGATTARGRASWSGLLKLSLVAVPIKAYPATSTSQEIYLNQLHAGCGQRIRHEKCCPIHGKVEAGALASGYQYA